MEWLGDVLAIFGIVMLASAFVEALALRFVVKRRYDWRSSPVRHRIRFRRPGYRDTLLDSST